MSSAKKYLSFCWVIGILFILSCTSGLTAKEYGKQIDLICKEVSEKADFKSEEELVGDQLIDYWVKVADAQVEKTNLMEELIVEPKIQADSVNLNSNNENLSKFINGYVDALLEARGDLSQLDVESVKFLLLEIRNLNQENALLYKKFGASNC
jgi:hypothetical protein